MRQTGTIDRGDGMRLAYTQLPGASPTVVFLPGFNSDMTGAKATAVAEAGALRGQAVLLLDYSGHGASGGAFADGTITHWAADARAVIEARTEGKLLLVGSSMGGWIALLMALAMPERVAGMVGIAAAPDFTQRLMWEAMSFEERARVMSEGHMMVPNPYGDPYPITRALIEDGRANLLLDRPVPLSCPVRLLHGQCDADVPWELALNLSERLESPDVQVTLIKDGDHRLSRPQDIALLLRTIEALLPQNGL
jgi:pimeloyl-ACP methyl ester carboxylesterase